MHCGKTHDYLGMTIIYNTKGKLVFTMFDYKQDVLGILPEEFHGKVETPATNHLFDVDKEIKKLNKDGGSIFHKLVAKILYQLTIKM